MQQAGKQGRASQSVRKSRSYPSSLPRLLETGSRQTRDAEMVQAGTYAQQADSLLNGKVPSQAMLSPFSPVFDLELEKRVNSNSTMERCCSEAHLGAGDAAKPTLLQQILQLCRCTSPIAAQLLQQLQRLRIAFAAAPGSTSSTSPPAVNGSSPTGAAASGFLSPESSMDIEAMACELLASGYLVQVRDGAQQQERARNTRSCLQNLRHRFIVCLGWRSSADAEPEYLPEPLVVEPRFREQFAIAHPTAEYEAVLQAVPPCFVGSVANLEMVVKLLCEQMVSAFKIQGLPVPPWRTRQALLSKWSPTQLAELAAKIANVRRLSIDMAGYGSGAAAANGVHAHERLCNGARPAAAHAPHAAVGSAPPIACNEAAGQNVQVFAAAAAQAAGPQQLTAEQLMAIMPAEMQQQLQQTLLQPAPQPVTANMASMVPMALQQQQTAGSNAMPSGHRLGQGNGCFMVHGNTVPISAVAGPLAPIHQGVPQHSGMPGPFMSTALPVGRTAGAAGMAAVAAGQGARGISPAAADVIALLEAAEGLTGSMPGTGTLKFTRKASAEWKNQRNNGRKMKGLLAAALKKSVAGSSRSNLSMSAGAADHSDPLAASAGLHMGTSSNSSAAHAGVVRDAASGGPDALIRRTHYRTSGDEPWRRITTVRWGAYVAQQTGQQVQQHAQQQAPSTAALATH